MDKTPKQFRAIAIRQLRLARPHKDTEARARAAVSSLMGENDLQKQPDLLHVEAVLVSEGVNENDDAFIREELAKAIASPVLKPMNWNHKDDQILGAMYSVEARDLDGNKLEEIGDEPFELIIQGAVWHHLPHIQTTAETIVQRIEKGDLFVSMECWFDNYNYGLYTQGDELYDLIPRNSDTVFLDQYLKANGGTGRYNGMRISRALTGINFGGIAFVDRPANKRSLILNQFTFDPTEALEEVGANENGLIHHQAVINNVVNDELMEDNMNDLNRAAASKDEIQDAVQAALAATKKVEAQERVQADLVDSTVRVAELEAELKVSDDALATLKAAVDHAFESAKAGATASTPEEIAKIDQALNVKGPGAADAVWAAKIAWIENSRSKATESLASSEDVDVNEKLVEENALLKKELATIKNEIREVELKHLFANVLEMTEDEVKTFVDAGLKIESDEAYAEWMDEKLVFAKKMMELKPKKGDKKKEEASDDSEAGLLSPSQRETPIEDHGATLRPELGRAPGDVPRVPRSKLTAAADIDALFEEVDGPNLAGAQAAGDGVTRANPMGQLVAGLLNKPSDNKDN